MRSDGALASRAREGGSVLGPLCGDEARHIAPRASAPADGSRVRFPCSTPPLQTTSGRCHGANGHRCVRYRGGNEGELRCGQAHARLSKRVVLAAKHNLVLGGRTVPQVLCPCMAQRVLSQKSLPFVSSGSPPRSMLPVVTDAMFIHLRVHKLEAQCSSPAYSCPATGRARGPASDAPQQGRLPGKQPTSVGHAWQRERAQSTVSH
jgi:hypothetical protein